MPIVQTTFAVGHIASSSDLPRTSASAGDHHEKPPAGLAPAEDLIEPSATTANVSLSRYAHLLDLIEIDTVPTFDLL
jgi:hypothetical protein